MRVLLALASVLLGCGAPMTYPRTPDVHRGVSVALRSNVSHGDAKAKYSVRPGQTPREGATTAAELQEPYEGHASSGSRSYNTWLRFIGILHSMEGSIAYGFSDTVALGGWFSSELVGSELRLQAFSERDGGPFSATFSIGGAHVGMFQSFANDLLREGWGARAGLDLGIISTEDELLVGGYASYIRRRRNFQKIPDDGEFHETWPGFFNGLMVVRDELKISVPIGYAVRRDGFAFILGLVPEWTVHASLHDWRCHDCSEVHQLDWFEQDFAIYITVGGEGWQERSSDSSPR